MKARILNTFIAGVLTAVALVSGVAQASIVISSTRLIYPAKEREITVQLSNKGDRPALAQAWIDSGDEHQDPSISTAPFVLVPPIARIDPGKGQSMRLTYLPNGALAKDRESIFWFNVLDIPPKTEASGANTVQIALRTRIKLFYRPEGLPGDPENAAKGLIWTVEKTANGQVVRATNNAAFSVSVTKVELTVSGKKISNEEGGLILPKSSKDFTLKGLTSSLNADMNVSYNWINDYGASVDGQAKIGEGVANKTPSD
ncbi:chaperone protein EcpD [Silvimonas terrae]|uniref:Chaperone protein EcpD n=1 Tax=Silvimonas terrae TaxID=300266 RepID=A0A840RHD0_9NEIS|nr:fimbria/pilus periplasmic chaperone [Silvimonas terrae]MBB5191840.1 chaperone protein EcpD [Silvimonas terrae]